MTIASEQVDDSVTQARFVFDDQDPHAPSIVSCAAELRVRRM
jgi:hypothetical protein